MKPELSVIICTFNNSSFLKGCLSCFVEQKLDFESCYELLVIDNNSTDDTKDIVDKFLQSERIPNLKYIFEPQPGLTNARLAGVKHASCNWIAFIDDDVRVQTDWIQSAITFGQSHPKAGAVSGRIRLRYLEPPSTAALMCESALCKVDYGAEEFHFQSEDPAIRLAGAAILFQKKALEESGWLEKRYLTDRTGKSLSSGGDTEMIMRVKNAGWEIWYTPTLQAEHLIPPHRTTVPYLCRLHRGLARTSAQLRAISLGGKVPFSFQLRHLFKDLSFTTRRILAWIFHDLIKGQSTGGKRFIQIHEGLGRIESCITFLLAPIKFSE